jgi:hypothetical protein
VASIEGGDGDRCRRRGQAAHPVRRGDGDGVQPFRDQAVGDQHQPVAKQSVHIELQVTSSGEPSPKSGEKAPPPSTTRPAAETSAERMVARRGVCGAANGLLWVTEVWIPDEPTTCTRHRFPPGSMRWRNGHSDWLRLAATTRQVWPSSQL